MSIYQKDYNPFTHLHSRLDILEININEIKKRLEMPVQNTDMRRKDIKEKYNISYSTIHNHMKSGSLKYKKVGGSTRFNRKDVEEWVKIIL